MTPLTAFSLDDSLGGYKCVSTSKQGEGEKTACPDHKTSPYLVKKRERQQLQTGTINMVL